MIENRTMSLEVERKGFLCSRLDFLNFLSWQPLRSLMATKPAAESGYIPAIGTCV